ncbi:MAG: orotidine-5'-phosphate decarboxylase [Pleurocapsa minor GSE-CHR-MK-17-07R]|jgi:orotidine-5'-phosphate decarboxylase|nr:orotidine-5'-phosphate decarboxylase [Pleurocapsa minor GSE-CHR-MK 17-07R]
MTDAVAKYRARAAAIDSLLCVGLDTDAAKIPAQFGGDVLAFNKHIIEQTYAFACAYKPNMAYYEARGADGWRDLADTMAYLRERHPDILTICDAKRADIGSTNAQYATAVFDHLGFDAITLHPYLGGEAIRPFLERADKASIILCHTSNPGADELQGLDAGGRPLWQVVADRAANAWNAHGNIMLVMGATYPEELKQVRRIVGDMPLLVPGIGAQGGDVDAVMANGLDRGGGGLIVNASRSIQHADDPAAAARALRDDMNRARRRAARAHQYCES